MMLRLLISIAIIINNVRSGSTLCPDSYTATVTQKCFKIFSDTQMTWDLAKTTCQKNGAILASISNAFEESKMEDMVRAQSGCSNTYLGGTCSDGNCVWTDGSNITYTDWNPNYNIPSGLKHISFSSQNKYWNAVDGTDNQCFLCEAKLKSDCLDWKNSGQTTSGIYPISLNGNSYNVYCDMTTDNGGWTVIQRRSDGTESFWDRSWSDFKNGFGNSTPGSNYWAGNELMHQLTAKNKEVKLRIDMWKDGTPGSHYADAYWYNQYDSFSVSTESDKYRLGIAINDWKHVIGNASTGWYDITYSNGVTFSTVDRINDPQTDCVTKYQMGGWWLQNCALSSLNGAYTPVDWSTGYGIFWILNGGDEVIHPRQTLMMLRAAN